MKRFAATLLFVLILTQYTLATETKTRVPENAIGQRYVVHMKSEPGGDAVRYEGEVVEVSTEKLVLAKAQKTVRAERSVPILGVLPFVGKLFRNVAIGKEKCRSNVDLDVADVQRAHEK